MDLAGKTVLVTGGCGLIGSTIVQRLVECDKVAEVRIIDDLSRGTLSNIDAVRRRGGVDCIQKDIRSYRDIRPHFTDVDVVFHQAAIRITACAEDRRECQEVLVNGTYNVVEACVDAGVKRFIAASSASVYGMADEFPITEGHHLYNNKTWYGAAKMANEALYRAFHEMTGLNYVALRYFNVYGPRMDAFGKYTEVLIRWLDCLDEGMPPKIFGDGRQTMDLVYSEDVARANIVAAKSDVTDEVFNIGSGRETSLRDLLMLLLEITEHKDIQPQYLPERMVNPVRRRLADTSKAKRMLGFECEVDLREGLRRLVEWRKGAVRCRQEDAKDPKGERSVYLLAHT